MPWADSHCHVPWEGGDTAVFDAARAAGVERFITIGTDGATSRTAIAAAQANPDVWATVGLHPHEASHGLDGLPEPKDHPGVVVGIGECGLDFHYDHSPRAAQRAVFARQIAWANELDLALVIHTREAWDETFAVLDAAGVPARTVFHCFTGGPAEAEACLARGAYLSISGIVTFPSANDVRAAVAVTPVDRLLVETDSPFLAPVPHRGRPNQPANVVVVGAAVAAVKDLSTEDIEAATWANTAAVFRLTERTT